MTSNRPDNLEYDSLYDFRTQYLQLIAKYWAHPQQVRDSYETWKPDCPDLPDCPGRLVWLSTEVGAEAPVPWKLDLKIEFFHGPTWEPERHYGRSGWIVDKEATFTVRLPVQQLFGLANSDETQVAVALASYYRHAHALAGPVEDGSKGGGQSMYGLPSMHEFEEFNSVSLRLLALVVREMTESSGESRIWDQFKVGGDPNTRRMAFGDLLEYTLPWNMDVAFDYDTTATWCNKEQCWRGLSCSELTLRLPTPPTDLKIRPVALAGYNTTGADHPLTCP